MGRGLAQGSELGEGEDVFLNPFLGQGSTRDRDFLGSKGERNGHGKIFVNLQTLT